MKPPQSFYDFTLEFHQAIDLVHPDWLSEAPDGRHELYEDFRQRYGGQAVDDLVRYFKRLLSNADADLEALWFKESKADWVISKEGLRKLFEDFAAWAESLQ